MVGCHFTLGSWSTGYCFQRYMNLGIELFNQVTNARSMFWLLQCSPRNVESSVGGQIDFIS